MTTGQVIILILYLSDESFEESPADIEHRHTMPDQLLIEHIQQGVRGMGEVQERFQQAVALLEDFVVGDEMLHVPGIQLAEEAVQPPAAVLASAEDDLRVIRRDHHGRELPDVPGEFLVAFIVQGDIFFAVLYGADDLVIFSAPLEEGFQPKTVCVVPDILRFRGVEIAFGEAEIINGVQEVRLPRTIPAGDADDPFGKTESPESIILELRE